MQRSSIPGGPWTLSSLESVFPWIKWQEPILVQMHGNEEKHYACRVCIANDGLKSEAIADLPRTPQEVTEHIALEHL